MEDDGVEHAAEAAARGGDAGGERLARGEVGAHDGDGGHEEAAEADAGADALREHDLPVRRAEGRHHHAEDDEEGACGDQGAEVACVVERAGRDAHEQEEVGLDGPDPGDVRRRLGQGRLVVRLVDAEGVDYAPISLLVSFRSLGSSK